MTTTYIIDFVNSQDYFSPPKELLLPIIITLFLLVVTNALMVGAWDTWEQYVFAPVAISLGVFIAIATINYTYAALIFTLMYLVLVYDAALASRLSRLLIKFLPKLILRFSTRGILLTFTLLAAVLVIINPNKQEIDISSAVGNWTDKYISKYVDDQIDIATETKSEEALDAMGLNPEQSELAKQSGLFNAISDFSKQELDLSELVTKETKNFIEPYKQFINPLMAVIVFGYMQILAFFAYLGYMMIIDMVFWMAKKTGLIIIEIRPAEQEVLRF